MPDRRRERKAWLCVFLFCIAGISINLTGVQLTSVLNIRLYLDSVGTIFVAALFGYLPGIFTGLTTNVVKTIFDSSAIYYSVINVLIAVCSAYLSKKGWFDHPCKALFAGIPLSIIGGGIGSAFSWLLYGTRTSDISIPVIYSMYMQGELGDFQALLFNDYLIDLADKLISVAVVFAAYNIVPARIKRVRRVIELKDPYAGNSEEKPTRPRFPLQAKITLVVSLSMLGVAIIGAGISSRMFYQTSISDHTKLGESAASMMMQVLDPEKINGYLRAGLESEDYLNTKSRLEEIKDSFREVEYMYVYQIKEDGCHVVFDLDTEDTPGSLIGEVIPFDESFSKYIPDLLNGEEIDPIITNDTYGWLLTIYEPVYDSKGVCVCYACADISMDQLSKVSVSYAARMVSMFAGFFVLILAAVLWASKFYVIYPINAISNAASEFALGDERKREESVKQIKGMDIRTGDEIENLYNAFSKTTSDCVSYVNQIKEQSENIEKMQAGLIMVLADVVESRDECTGNHIKNTSAYVRLILDEMKKEGIYKEMLTDEYVSTVISSAPLHDVGKIKIPDAILNKPGRLTDDEFHVMQTHTIKGNDIIEEAIEIVPDPMYLQETRNLAEYHHEKWDGSGYPNGLKGEKIPLSARIMAVADVFDALVSKRSYKEGMPYDKAFSIIEEGAGSHFDPEIAKAFLNRRDDAIKIAEASKGKTNHEAKT